MLLELKPKVPPRSSDTKGEIFSVEKFIFPRAKTCKLFRTSQLSYVNELPLPAYWSKLVDKIGAID